MTSAVDDEAAVANLGRRTVRAATAAPGVTAHLAGVRIVFGTDGGVLPHGENAEEFAMLAKAGVPLLDAIRAATINAAAAFGLGNDVGQIKVGDAADMIAIGRSLSWIRKRSLRCRR